MRCNFPAAVFVAFAILSTNVAAVPAPPLLSPAQVTGSSVTLAWTVPFGATGIRLEAGTAPGLSNAANAIVGPISGYSAANVPSGTYFVRVRAIDATGESASSNEITVVVGATPPSCSAAPNAPLLAPAAVSGNNVSFAWTSTGCPATAFALHAGSSAGLSNLAIVNSVAPGFGASGPNGTYFVRVVASNPFGSAVSNEVQFSLGPQLFRFSGTGNTVFDAPAMSRVRVIGTFTGFCQNFVMRVNGRLLVNEILGTCSSSSGTRIEGIYLTTGGVVEVTSSAGVAWEFIQVQ